MAKMHSKASIKSAVDKAAMKHLPRAIDSMGRSKALDMAHAATRDDMEAPLPAGASSVMTNRPAMANPTSPANGKGFDGGAGERHGIHGKISK